MPTLPQTAPKTVSLNDDDRLSSLQQLAESHPLRAEAIDLLGRLRQSASAGHLLRLSMLEARAAELIRTEADAERDRQRRVDLVGLACETLCEIFGTDAAECVVITSIDDPVVRAEIGVLRLVFREDPFSDYGFLLLATDGCPDCDGEIESKPICTMIDAGEWLRGNFRGPHTHSFKPDSKHPNAPKKSADDAATDAWERAGGVVEALEIVQAIASRRIETGRRTHSHEECIGHLDARIDRFKGAIRGGQSGPAQATELLRLAAVAVQSIADLGLGLPGKDDAK